MNEPFEQLTLEQLRLRGSVKWQLYPPDVLPMWVAEMDVLPVAEVSQTLMRALDRGDTGYAYGRDYQSAFGRFANRLWGWEPDLDSAIVVADVMTGIRESILATTDPASVVVIPTPVYPPFLSFTRELGRKVVEVPLRGASDRSLRLDLPALTAILEAQAGTRAAVLLCSPHNPTGTVHTRAELSQLAACAAQTGTTVIVDEIHAPLTQDPSRFVPYLSLPNSSEAILVTSASKTFNLAALKAALVVPGSSAQAAVSRFGEHVRYGASYFGVLSHVAALDHGDDWLARVNSNIAANRQYLESELQRQSASTVLVPGEATYLCWIDATGLCLGPDPATELRLRGRVAFSPGIHFGAGGTGHFRFNVAASRAVIKEAVTRIAQTAGASGAKD